MIAKSIQLLFTIFLSGYSLLSLVSCSGECEGNLVCNPSFESAGQPSLNCWKLQMDTTTYLDWYSMDVPPDGGQYSLKLAGSKDASFDPYAETFMTGLSGNQNLEISAFIQALYGGQSIYLTATQKRNGMIVQTADQSDWAFNGWKKFTITENFQFESTDTLYVHITQTTGQNSACLVDQVCVIKL